jgi:hypothetical protein
VAILGLATLSIGRPEGRADSIFHRRKRNYFFATLPRNMATPANSMVSALTAEAGSISGAVTGPITLGTPEAHAIPQAAIEKDAIANNFDTLNSPLLQFRPTIFRHFNRTPSSDLEKDCIGVCRHMPTVRKP